MTCIDVLKHADINFIIIQLLKVGMIGNEILMKDLIQLNAVLVPKNPILLLSEPKMEHDGYN
jgi:hypothetical protein